MMGLDTVDAQVMATAATGVVAFIVVVIVLWLVK